MKVHSAEQERLKPKPAPAGPTDRGASAANAPVPMQEYKASGHGGPEAWQNTGSSIGFRAFVTWRVGPNMWGPTRRTPRVTSTATGLRQVIHDFVYLRQEPSLHAPILGKRPKGETFLASEETWDGWVPWPLRFRGAVGVLRELPRWLW